MDFLSVGYELRTNFRQFEHTVPLFLEEFLLAFIYIRNNVVSHYVLSGS